MIIIINKDSFSKEPLYLFLRKCGYSPGRSGSFVKPLSPLGYPRYHIYKKEDAANYILNLHLDMKKPSYLKNQAHSGQYQGKLIKEEKSRILKILTENL